MGNEDLFKKSRTGKSFKALSLANISRESDGEKAEREAELR